MVDKISNPGGKSSPWPVDPWLVAGCGVVLLYWLVLYIPAPEAHIRAHDFLSPTFNYYVMRAGAEGWFLNFDARLGALNGLPVSALGLGDFSLPAALFDILPPFEALVVLLGLLRIGGFIGLYLLLRDHVLRGLGRISLIAVVVALSFTFLSHMPSRFGNILLLPLLLWALFNLWQGRRGLISATVCLGFPLVWAFIYGGYVISVVIGFTVVAAYISRAPGRHRLMIVALGFGLVTLLAEARLFVHILFKPFESYRAASTFSDWDNSLGRMFFNHFFRDANGHHTVGQFPVLVAVVFGTLIYLMAAGAMRRRAGPAKSEEHQAGPGDAQQIVMRRLLLALAVTVGVSLAWAALRLYQPLIAQTFNFPHRLDRVDIFSPVLWRIDTALALAALALSGPFLVRRVAFVACLLGVGLFALQQQAYEIKSAVAKSLGAPPYASLRALAQNAVTGRAFSEDEVRFFSRQGYPRLKDFFRIEAFKAIDAAVAPLGERDTYRVMAIDLAPSLLQFHGFHTLGGYFYEHAGSYGADFAKMFAVEQRKKYGPEVPLPPLVKAIFAPVAEASRKAGGLDVEFDVCRFRASGGRLVFSPEPLLSAARLGFERIAMVEGLRPQVRFARGFNYYDKIYLYQTIVRSDQSAAGPPAGGNCPNDKQRLQHP